MSGSTLATAVEQLYIPVHAEGITMSMDDIVAVDSHSRLVLEPFKRPDVTAAMTAHNPAEQEGRATAMALATMAANYFVHEANPGRVLEAAKDKEDLQTAMRKALEDPQKSLVTATFLQSLQAADNGQMELPITRQTSIHMPTAHFTMSGGQLSGICFEYGPGRNYSGEQLCAERKDK